MGLHDLRPPKGMKHSKKRVGRGQGSGQGKTAGRGHKGAVVTPEALHEKGLVGGGSPKIKILARGEVGKALTVKAHKFSGKAAEKIAAAGGATEQLA